MIVFPYKSRRVGVIKTILGKLENKVLDTLVFLSLQL